MRYTKLMRTLASIINDDLPIIIYFENGFAFRSFNNTGVFETTNCLEMDDDNYLEYYAYAAEVTEVIQLPEKMSNEEIENFKIGNFIELSEINEPIKIELQNGQMVWQREEMSK